MSKQTTRAIIVAWLEAEPGLTSRDLCIRANCLRSYMTERLRHLELGGFIRRGDPDAHTELRWFARPDHPPLGRPKRPPLPKASVPPSMKMLRGVAPQRGQIIVRGPAVDHDSTIVGQALAQMPELQAAWMGRAQA